MFRLLSLGFLACVISFLAGCSKPEENYVGSWYNENEHSFFDVIQIEPNDKSFIVTIDLLGGPQLSSKYQALKLDPC